MALGHESLTSILTLRLVEKKSTSASADAGAMAPVIVTSENLVSRPGFQNALLVASP